ncbi:hypothetical protein, partial [Xanthomonas campestris]|uniref:hypothetical protein n=1 Tax=Xanthomonas campestris TaxID=339 RepID=UPI0040397B1F
VNIRHNACCAPYPNNYACAVYGVELLPKTLSAESNTLHQVRNSISNAGSSHLYETEPYFVDHYAKTGEPHIAKKDYVGEWKQ